MSSGSHDGTPLQTRAERSAEVMEGYKKAFWGFSEEELSILDGIILDLEHEAPSFVR
jgi:hypothetical protein